ncbi:hypothetical protein A4X09_0g5391 [Tilletia walkeri]|uniref:Reverse transcriptase Ty1/copia-type domain-containing protein n=1 Tax=Tilletia walkeri TaxID=117179 RepID=A0A8X7N724_9BASI|nr:hypothetical protein A4X09_0g5391 [Tilletia walkeri]
MSTRLRNWMPTRALPPPARLLLGSNAAMPKLRVFGSSCWVMGQGGEKGKFAAKSAKFLFIGYAHSDTYRLWDELNERVVVSRNVVFDESDRPPRLNLTPAQTAPATEQVFIDIAPPNMESRFSKQMDAAREAVQARMAAAQQRAREVLDQREQTVQAASQQAEQGTSAEQGETEEAGNPQQEETERRTSRRLAGEGPEVEYALLAAAVPVTDRRENPKSIREAMERKDWVKWKEAIEIELGALKETGTYQFVDTPRDADILTGKWVLTIKYNADGTISKYKARWVARGYSQIEGIDFDETHAPTARMASVRMVGALAAVDGLELIQWDYTTAYLNGELHNAVYIQPPEGVEVPAGKTWKLMKALYALKQAGRVEGSGTSC